MNIIEIVQNELRVSLGCTEPASIALAAATARNKLGTLPEKVKVWVSANYLKNAMGVGVPKTKHQGIDLIAAMGVQSTDCSRALEVLETISAEDEQNAWSMVQNKQITVELAEDVNPVYVKVTVQAGNQEATAIIEGEHHRLVFLEKDGEVELDQRELQLCVDPDAEDPSHAPIDIEAVINLALEAPIEDIKWIKEAEKLNMLIAQEGISGDYNLHLPDLSENPLYKDSFKALPFSAIMGASCGVEARMSGSGIPVMTNSGSGNQGIIATVPVVEYAKALNASWEKKIRALFLSHAITVALKSHVGRLSALCGAFYAATGSGCGIAYLQGGGKVAIENTIMNMVANQTGIICDGAKSSCALKTLSTLYTAVISAELGLQQRRIPQGDGIIRDNVSCTLKNFERVIQSTKELDRAILDTMLHPATEQPT